MSTGYQQQAQTEMWERVDVGQDASRASPPTAKQIYALARALLDRTQRRWPSNRQEASELIERLRSQNR